MWELKNPALPLNLEAELRDISCQKCRAKDCRNFSAAPRFGWVFWRVGSFQFSGRGIRRSIRSGRASDGGGSAFGFRQRSRRQIPGLQFRLRSLAEGAGRLCSARSFMRKIRGSTHRGGGGHCVAPGRDSSNAPEDIARRKSSDAAISWSSADGGRRHAKTLAEKPVTG